MKKLISDGDYCGFARKWLTEYDKAEPGKQLNLVRKLSGELTGTVGSSLIQAVLEARSLPVVETDDLAELFDKFDLWSEDSRTNVSYLQVFHEFVGN